MAREGKLTQRCDHRRLGRQLLRRLSTVAMTEALARLGDADEVAEIKLLTYARQQLQRKVNQAAACAKPIVELIYS
jgi:hypothetical protein